MSTDTSTCPVWGTDYHANYQRDVHNRLIRVFDSPRAGGSYCITSEVVEDDIPRLSLEQKARLTTWLIDQRIQGVELPTITKDIIGHIKVKRPLSVQERANRLLRHLAEKAQPVGSMISVNNGSDPSAYAWSESTIWREVSYFLHYLTAIGYLDGTGNLAGGFQGVVTISGYSHIAELNVNVDSSQAFVAMWFDDSMTDCFAKGIEPAVMETGYKPLRIDLKEHINKIDDEIIAEIRRSRFLVADFTQGPDGARGGVYYEAGLAHGLGLPVIFTCRQDAVESLHFDTNHYNHIVWATPEELREKLKNRILAVIGEGPAIGNNP